MENKIVIILLIFLFGYGLYYGMEQLEIFIDSSEENGAVGDESNQKTTPRRGAINEAQRVTVEANTNTLIKAIETDFIFGNIEAGQILVRDNEVVEGVDIRAILPDDGLIVVRDDGKIALTIVDKGFCIVKGFEESLTEIFVYEEECSHPDVE